MATRLNRVPLGLLSFLDSKVAGQTPQLLSDQISATLELGQFLAASQAVDLFGQVAAASTGVVGVALASNFMGVGGGAFRVPPGEIWLVQHYSVRSGTLLAATEYQFTLGFQSPLPGIAGAAVWHAVSQPVAVGSWTAGMIASAGCWDPFVMVSGDQAGVLINRVALGTADNFFVSMRAVRLLV